MCYNGTMKTLPLSQGLEALVDDSVYDLVSQYKWSAAKSRSERRYAVRSVYNPRKTVFLHRFIWESVNGVIPDKLYIDHISRDTLDNRLANLRLVTTSQNMVNRDASATNKFNERGIHLDRQRGKYCVELWRNKKRVLRKYFDTLELAVEARDSFLQQPST